MAAVEAAVPTVLPNSEALFLGDFWGEKMVDLMGQKGGTSGKTHDGKMGTSRKIHEHPSEFGIFPVPGMSDSMKESPKLWEDRHSKNWSQPQSGLKQNKMKIIGCFVRKNIRS